MNVFSRITFIVFLTFWLVMTYLLWRSEYSAESQVGSAVPLSLVWRKIVSAPDISSLQIIHNGRKMGYCRWSSSAGQDLASSKVLADDAPPLERTGTNAGAGVTRLDLEGNVIFDNNSGRLQLHGELMLTTNDEWKEFDLRLGMKPVEWEIHSKASDQTVRVQTDDEQGKTTHVIPFADFQKPEQLLRDFDVPMPAAFLSMMHLPLQPQSSNNASAYGLEWKAHNDWISFGHTSVRAFRLDAAALERYRVKIIISRVGEILRVELPDGWQLVNDQLLNL